MEILSDPCRFQYRKLPQLPQKPLCAPGDALYCLSVLVEPVMLKLEAGSMRCDGKKYDPVCFLSCVHWQDPDCRASSVSVPYCFSVSQVKGRGAVPRRAHESRTAFTKSWFSAKSTRYRTEPQRQPPSMNLGLGKSDDIACRSRPVGRSEVGRYKMGIRKPSVKVMDWLALLRGLRLDHWQVERPFFLYVDLLHLVTLAFLVTWSSTTPFASVHDDHRLAGREACMSSGRGEALH